MSEAIATLAEQAIRNPAPEQRGITQKLFMLFHGAWGNLFLSRFVTGNVDEQGRDRGVLSAMKVWASSLRDTPDEVIEQAARRLIAEGGEYPPALPAFQATCRACTPRKTHAELTGYVALPAPKVEPKPFMFPRKNDGRDWARRIVASHEAGNAIATAALVDAKTVLRGEA